MEEAFWLMWKLATPILGIAVLRLLVERHQRQRQLITERDTVDVLQAQNSYLRRKLTAAYDDAHKLHMQVNDAQHSVEDLQQVAACASCAQVEALRQRNNQLVLANLAANCKLVLHSTN